MIDASPAVGGFSVSKNGGLLRRQLPVRWSGRDTDVFFDQRRTGASNRVRVRADPQRHPCRSVKRPGAGPQRGMAKPAGVKTNGPGQGHARRPARSGRGSLPHLGRVSFDTLAHRASCSRPPSTGVSVPLLPEPQVARDRSIAPLIAFAGSSGRHTEHEGAAGAQ